MFQVYFARKNGKYIKNELLKLGQEEATAWYRLGRSFYMLGACGWGKFDGGTVWHWEALLHHSLEHLLWLAKGHNFRWSCPGDQHGV